jgi:hypothetical protein
MPAPPEWLTQLVHAAAECICPHDILSPLGCHYQHLNEVWEITLFASKTEIVGGPQDGLNYSSGFNIEVLGLTKLFSEVENVSWQSQTLGPTDDLGTHISVEGIYADRKVWLRITSKAPERFGVGRRALINQQRIEELW